MAAIGTQPQATQQIGDTARRYATPLLLVGFSLYYFANVLLRASEKYFWFDELVTLYVCRLPGFHAMWDALRHGIDFNPPLFFLITGASKALFGENLIGLRVPEMVGFWVLCLCLYLFVSRRAGRIAGVIAMVLPTLTGAFYYAYEARPHAIVLGFCGLALVCWQIANDRLDQRWWIAAFSLCLLLTFLLHCFALTIAAPFAIVEIFRSIRSRRLNLVMWIAIIAPACIAVAQYVPLLLSYRANASGTSFAALFLPSVGQLADYYNFLFSPCIMVVIGLVALLAADRAMTFRAGNGSETRQEAITPEIILTAAFLALPIIGLAMARAVSGPFFARYFLSGMVGACALIGLGVGARKKANWVAVTLAVLLAFPLTWQFLALLWHWHQGTAETLIEPSSKFTMNVTLKGPLERYSVLLSPPGDSRPIAVLDPLDFLYLLNYAPDLRPRLYYVKDAENDFFYTGFQHLHSWSPFKYNPELTRDGFLALASGLLVYGPTERIKELPLLTNAGAAIKSVRVSNDHFLAALEPNRIPAIPNR